MGSARTAPGCGSGLKPPIGMRVIDSTPAQTKSLAGAHLDGAGRHVDRLHRRAAEAVHRRAADRLAAGSARKPMMRATLKPCSPSGKAQPTIRSSMSCGVDAGALDEGAHHLRGDVVGPDAGELALLGGRERRPGVTGDDDVLMDLPLLEFSSWALGSFGHGVEGQLLDLAQLFDRHLEVGALRLELVDPLPGAGEEVLELPLAASGRRRRGRGTPGSGRARSRAACRAG